MTIQDKLANLITIYCCNRGAGHTSSMINGAKFTDCAIVTSGYSSKKWMKSMDLNNDIVTLDEFFLYMKGRYKPFVFDNMALDGIFRMALSEISRLENKNSELEKDVEKIKSFVNQF